jgi:threonine aldolase
MRQSGILAAGALWALEHNRDRLGEDHAAARSIAAALRAVPGVVVGEVETNLVNVDTPGVPAERLVMAAGRRGVLVGSSGPHRVRVVTHLDVKPDDVPRAAQALVESAHEVLA